MQKILYILRHAKAETLHSGQEDHARRLTPRGVEEAGRMGKYLAAQGIRPDKVWCSTAARAKETLENVQKQTPAFDIDYSDKLYLASVNEMLGLIAAIPETVHSLMLIGHNPGLHELCLTLAKDGDNALRLKLTATFPTCALAMLAFDGAWRDTGRLPAALTGFITPKML